MKVTIGKVFLSFALMGILLDSAKAQCSGRTFVVKRDCYAFVNVELFEKFGSEDRNKIVSLEKRGLAKLLKAGTVVCEDIHQFLNYRSRIYLPNDKQNIKYWIDDSCLVENK